MYSIDGVPLDNSALGWVFRSGSQPYSGMEADIVSSRATGRDGAKNGMSTYGSPTLKLVVQTPLANLEALNALFRGHDLTLRKVSDSSRLARITLVTSEPARFYPGSRLIDMAYYVQIDGAYWRGATQTTTAPVTLSSASVVVDNILPGISAPVQDAIIRVRGGFTNLRITDTSGAWVTVNSLNEGAYVRIDCATLRAWWTNSDTWEGGQETSGRCDFGGPRDLFEITPRWTSSNPASRAGRLTVETATRTTQARIEIRGRGAFLE